MKIQEVLGNHISRPLHLILARILAKVIYDTKKDKVLPIPVVFTKKHMVRFWILYSLSKRFHWNQTSFIPFTKLFYAYQISSGGHTGTVHVQRTSSWNIANCDLKYYLKRVYAFFKYDICDPPWIQDCQHVVCVFVSRVSCLQKRLDLVWNLMTTEFKLKLSDEIWYDSKL